MNEMLISTYNLWILILVGCFYMAFPPRGEVSMRDVGLINLICGLFGVIIAMMLGLRSMSGLVIESFEFTSALSGSTDFYLFFLAAIVLSIVLLLDIIMYFKQRID